MPFYAISTSLIIQTLTNVFKDVKQVWLADDASAAGSLKSLVCFLNWFTAEGAKCGYFVNEKKSWLILKRDNDMDEAKQLFRNHSIQITSEGQRHLGAALGSPEYRNKYINEKVNGWVKELEKLSMIAVAQPQAAYSAFVNGYKHKFTYFIRTIPDISHLLSPLVECIYERLLPAIFGCQLSPDLQDIIALPTRLGGMGIGNVKEESAQEYASSKLISAPLANLIVQQRIHKLSSDEELSSITREPKKQRIHQMKEKAAAIQLRLQPPMKNTLEIAMEKGASNWFIVLSLEDEGYVLHKAEFVMQFLCDMIYH